MIAQIWNRIYYSRSAVWLYTNQQYQSRNNLFLQPPGYCEYFPRPLYTLARCAPRSGGHAGRCRRSACAWSRSLVSVFRVYNCSHQSTRQPAPGTMRTRQLCSERALRKPETKDAAARQRSRLSRSRARGAAARSLPPEVGGCGLSLRSQERPPKRDSIITSRRAPPPRWFW